MSTHEELLKFDHDTAATVTFADCGENHVGMQIEGQPTARTTTLEDLRTLQEQYQGQADFYPLEVPSATAPPGLAAAAATGLLVLRNCAGDAADRMMHEIQSMNRDGLVDKKSLQYGKVRDKWARWNNVISWRNQAPDLPSGQGTIVSFEDYPALRALHDRIHTVLDQHHAQRLVGELNLYPNVKTCGIGYHGDKERNIVAGLSLGKATAEQTLKFVPYFKLKVLQEPIEITLAHGDVYIMAYKAVGSDCAKRNIVTWRHARGAPTCKYSVVNPKHKGTRPAKTIVKKRKAASAN
jgi:hypothetical protein